MKQHVALRSMACPHRAVRPWTMLSKTVVWFDELCPPFCPVAVLLVFVPFAASVEFWLFSLAFDPFLVASSLATRDLQCPTCLAVVFSKYVECGVSAPFPFALPLPFLSWLPFLPLTLSLFPFVHFAVLFAFPFAPHQSSDVHGDWACVLARDMVDGASLDFSCWCRARLR